MLGYRFSYAMCVSLAGIFLASPVQATPTPSFSSLNSSPEIHYNLSPQELANHCNDALNQAQHRIDKILSQPSQKATFANVILGLENVLADTGDGLVAEQFLGSVSSDRNVRSASDVCQNMSSTLAANLNTRPELAKMIGVIDTHHPSLPRAEAKLLDMWRAATLRSGAGLPEAKREQVRSLLHRIQELETAFAANLADAAPTIVLPHELLTGIPADLLAGFRRNNDGSYIVPISESLEQRFLANAAAPEARRMYLTSYLNRGYPQNVPLLNETLALRLRLAHLLGYSTWAEYILADRMAGNIQRVHRFLDDLDERLLPAARADVAALTALKASDLRQPSALLEPWDVAYYHEMGLRRKYRLDTDQVRRYFPVEHTISAVLGIYAKLLGLSFTRVDSTQTWSPDVLEYRVADAASGYLRGTLYLDLYPRLGKYTHFASFPLLPVRRLKGGTLRPAVDAIVGNWSRSAPGQPALLSHDEVQTFFHEFGHAMAALLATTPYETLSSGFRTDFVEAPSQMLENWVWTPSILVKLSQNIDDRAPMPDAMIKNLIGARYVDEAYFTTRQILYADVDLAFHGQASGESLTQRWSNIQAQVTPLSFLKDTHPEAAFGHIMGGYDAGYYGYLWSKVYAQDMFSAFEHEGLENTEVGSRYRTTILEPAREMEPDEEVRAFLGRPMQPEAFYRTLGLQVLTP